MVKMNKEIVKRLKDSLDYEFDLSYKDRMELLSYIEQLKKQKKELKNYLQYQIENLDFYEDTKAMVLCTMALVMLEGDNNENN